ncbi:MAG: type 3 dihydrofolate reductase [Gammaproteobacteria bacterium]|nr:type 3 dihydrofolate reductase [Gammaproteobacteria bacterium]
MLITLIVAASTNDVIGVDGQLPWRLSSDLQRFKQLTMGKPIVMGRLTWESIGRPLPGRQNIVITRNPDYVADGCDVVTSPAAALAAAGDVDEVMIIGGSQVYELFRPMAGRLYLTRVDVEINGDAHFAAPEDDSWQLTHREAQAADENNEFAFEFRIYERKDRS